MAEACPVPVGDPCPREDAPRNALERAALPWLTDRRDLAFVRLAVRATCLPAVALALYLLPPWLSLALALPYYWLLYARFGGPVMLMVHALHHRRSFQGRGRVLEAWINHGLPLLYGLQPHAYRAQHIAMHHAEGNGAADLSSTRGYRRDSVRDFLVYYARFMTVDNLGLARYLRRRGLDRLLRRYLAGSALFGLGVVLLAAWNLPATLVVLVLPYCLTRFFLMAGNWAQHAFAAEAVDGGESNATVLINASHNRRCFNDGYHAIHHRHPGLHWAEMAAKFRADWHYYAERRVLVFDGMANNQVVWWHLMRGDFTTLARHLADFGWLPAGLEDRAALLARRARA